jgi:hypothetical protein
MKNGIDQVATVWLVCLAVLSALFFAVMFSLQARGVGNKVKVFLIPILPLAFVLAVEGFKGHSINHALVLYSDAIIASAVVGIGARMTARRRAQIINSATDDEMRELSKKAAWWIGGSLVVLVPLLLLVEYGPLFSW